MTQPQKQKGKVTIKRVIRKTAGGTHAWYEAEIADENGTAIVLVRKQILQSTQQ